MGSCVGQAVQRAELPAGTDAAEVVRAVSAPLCYGLLISGDPVDEASADGLPKRRRPTVPASTRRRIR
ncbi:TetR/AcrR family transcriptional regulator C-terminal ligand-binding domain-containing protein [Micromonospora sp. CPCC 205546]|uniref:TetR/AcrR family transcriptional regulator C-terminal ligand-binding domain-containing protein n=1 Tax=Micromonospora sp. CPCC 205546 TaxID=3122397 RepID=UPI002FEE6926